MMVRMSLCGELQLVHHLARHAVRAVRVGVEGELHRASVSGRVADLEAQARVLSSRMRPLTRKSSEPPLRRSSLASAAAIDARSSLARRRETRTLFERREPRLIRPSPLAAVLPLIDGDDDGSAARDDLVVPTAASRRRFPPRSPRFLPP